MLTFGPTVFGRPGKTASLPTARWWKSRLSYAGYYHEVGEDRFALKRGRGRSYDPTCKVLVRLLDHGYYIIINKSQQEPANHFWR